MARSISEKIEFLQAEIDGLRARAAGQPNAVQSKKLAMMTDIKRDYQAVLDRRNAGAV